MALQLYEVDVQDEYTHGEMQVDAEFDSDDLCGSVLQWLCDGYDECGVAVDLHVHQATQNGNDWQFVILDRCQDDEGCLTVTCKVK